MIKYFDEEWPKEEEILNIGLKMSRQNKADRQKMKRVFCIGNGESRKGFDLDKLKPFGKIYGCNAIYRDYMPDVLTAVDHGIMHEIYHAGVAQKIPCYFRDWTKVPAMTYEQMLYGAMDKTEADETLKKVLKSNERGDSKEYVMHGSNIQGIVNMIKRDPKKYNDELFTLEKKHINHATIKVSWIKEPDYSYSIRDLEPFPGQKTGDYGWACGASSGYVAILKEKPDEIYLIGHDLHSETDKVNNLYKGTKHYVAPENGPTPAINWINQWYTLSEWFPNVKFIKINKYNDSRDQVNGPIKEWEKRKNITYADYSTLDNLA
tara:strand:- start:207 stop:1166 length:960 start_codon:yes stop_codon:yes gene_type:complete